MSLWITPKSDAEEKSPDIPTHTTGIYEYIYLPNSQVPIKAKADTGAGLSSLSAIDIVDFRRNGRQWVRFHVPINDKLITLEAPKLKTTKIRYRHEEVNSTSAKENSEFQLRTMIELTICLNQHWVKTQVNLSDRRQFIAPFLLGRNTLKDEHLVVDPSQRFLFSRHPCVKVTS